MKQIDTQILTESGTAERLGISISGLRKWRRDGSGPRYIRLGRLIRYLGTDVQEWLRAHTVTADPSETNPQVREG